MKTPLSTYEPLILDAIASTANPFGEDLRGLLDSRTDMQLLRSDWETVGEDLSTGIRSFEAELKKSQLQLDV